MTTTSLIEAAICFQSAQQICISSMTVITNYKARANQEGI